MTKRKPTGFSEAAKEIDLRLGDLLGHLGEALDEVASRLVDAAEDGSEIRREKMFETGTGPVRASAGIRIRTLGGSEETHFRRPPEKPINTPHREGESTETASPPPQDPAPRSVEATIFNEPDAWALVADMPGISRQDVTWTVEGNVLSLIARNDTRHYRLETDLPKHLLETKITCHVANGILELRAEG